VIFRKVKQELWFQWDTLADRIRERVEQGYKVEVAKALEGYVIKSRK